MYPFKIKDKGYLGKLLKLGFIIYLARYHIKEEYMLIKLGKPENNYITGYKSYQKPIPLLIYEDHLMLYNINITFSYQYYMNEWHPIGASIKDKTLIRMTTNQKQTLLYDIERFMLVKHL